MRALAVAAAAAFTACDQQVVGTEPNTPEKPDSTGQNLRGRYINTKPAAPTNPALPKPPATAPDPEFQKLPGEPVEAPRKPDTRPEQAVLGLYAKDSPEDGDAKSAATPDPNDIPQALPGDVPAQVKE